MYIYVCIYICDDVNAFKNKPSKFLMFFCVNITVTTGLRF